MGRANNTAVSKQILLRGLQGIDLEKYTSISRESEIEDIPVSEVFDKCAQFFSLIKINHANIVLSDEVKDLMILLASRENQLDYNFSNDWREFNKTYFDTAIKLLADFHEDKELLSELREFDVSGLHTYSGKKILKEAYESLIKNEKYSDIITDSQHIVMARDAVSSFRLYSSQARHPFSETAGVADLAHSISKVYGLLQTIKWRNYNFYDYRDSDYDSGYDMDTYVNHFYTELYEMVSKGINREVKQSLSKALNSYQLNDSLNAS